MTILAFFKTRSAKASPLPAEIRHFSSSDCIETSPLSEVRFSHLWIGSALILPRLAAAEKMSGTKMAPEGLLQLSGATLCALCLGAHDRRFTRLQSDSGSQAKPSSAEEQA
ncbi:MAG: hypothetical protein KHY26_11510, partial [Faecalibacterium prausnitzii]|nr:hypothetical protein [Faecalibacterium prausnitzii]